MHSTSDVFAPIIDLFQLKMFVC